MTDELKRQCTELIDRYHDVDDPEPWMSRALNVMHTVVQQPTAGPKPDPEQVGWLRTLIGSYHELRDQLDAEGFIDEDPNATFEMLDAVSRLADALDPPRPPEHDQTDLGASDDRPLGPDSPLNRRGDNPPIPF